MNQSARKVKRSALNRERLIRAASDLIETEGVDAVTFRRLAEEFDVTPMALYRHVKDKDDILSAVLSGLLAEALFPPRSTRWDVYLRRYAAGLRQLLLEHRSLVRAILRSDSLELPALDAMEATLSILREAGFSTRQASEIFTAVNSFTIGSALWQVMRSEGSQPDSDSVGAPASPTSSASAEGRYWVMNFDGLDADQFPELRRHARSLRSRTFDRDFSEGIDRLIATAQSGA